MIDIIFYILIFVGIGGIYTIYTHKIPALSLLIGIIMVVGAGAFWVDGTSLTANDLCNTFTNTTEKNYNSYCNVTDLFPDGGGGYITQNNIINCSKTITTTNNTFDYCEPQGNTTTQSGKTNSIILSLMGIFFIGLFLSQLIEKREG